MHRLYAWLREHPTFVDGAWATLLAATSLAQVALESLRDLRGFGVRSSEWEISGQALAVLLLGVAVTLRRRHPAAMGAITLGVGLLQIAVDIDFVVIDVVMLLMVYNSASYGRRWLSRGSLLAAILAGPAVLLPHPSVGFSLVGCTVFAAPFVLAWVVGDSLRTRRAYYAELEDRTRRLERDRDVQERYVAAAERVRIARELHDVIAHSISVMIVQADGAKYVLDLEPEQAGEAIRNISVTGRQSLAQMRQLLGVLRSGEGVETKPQPDMGQISDFLQTLRDSGLPVDIVVEGDAYPLPRGIGLSVFRIIQEVLTSIHARSSRTTAASIRLRFERAELCLSVEIKDLRITAASRETAEDELLGGDLIGVCERIALIGGTFSTQRCLTGFCLNVVLPISPSESEPVSSELMIAPGDDTAIVASTGNRHLRDR
ncbi:sensor histidine kinase [Streptomyces lydicus]